MQDLTGKRMLFTELENTAAFRNYCMLKFSNLVGILKKKSKILKFRIFYTKGIRNESFVKTLFIFHHPTI